MDLSQKQINLLKNAISQYGVKEIPGNVDNSVIMQYAKDCGFTNYIHDEISWCSLFANWVALKSDCVRSNDLAARSWLKVGTETTIPQIGDVVVLWRVQKEGWQGHVGFYIRSDENYIYILAGNQGNAVSIEPFSKSFLLGYRTL